MNETNLENQALSRDKIIVRTSIVGIIANVLLSAFKAAVGLMTNSIAITLDAVNNISDAASSVITIVGTKLAGREPDRKHPFGYGRIEYLSAMVISLLVLYAGITSLTESVKKIIHPETPDYSAVALVIVAVGVVVKILLGRYVKRVGKKVDSDALVNSGEDATLDSIISASTLVAAVIYIFAHISLEAYLGAVISVVIIKSGIEMLRDTLSRVLGERADADMVKTLKQTICTFPEVSGAYDVVIHDYGPNTYHGSVHIEVPDTCIASDLDDLLRKITMKVYREHHILLTAIGVYSVNTRDPHAIAIREDVKAAALAHPSALQLHGFYLNEQTKEMRFDLVVSFNAENRRAVYQQVLADIQSKYPDYTITAAMDIDFTGA